MIGQLVKILEGGEELKLSKRAGNIITLQEFIDAVGVDAVRYTLCRYPVDSPLTLDIVDMTVQKSENPVFYVQYAHARISSLLRNAEELGIKTDAARPSIRGCSTTSGRASCCTQLGSSRGSSRRRPSCASRTGSPATSRSSPGTTTASTTPVGCCPRATPTSPS